MSEGIIGTRSETTNEKTPRTGGDPPKSEAEAAQDLIADSPPQAPAEAIPARPKRPRGFAAMDRELVSTIARKGGKAAHSAGTAHEFTSAEARVAGQKGGRATHVKRRRIGENELAKAELEKPSQ